MTTKRRLPKGFGPLRFPEDLDLFNLDLEAEEYGAEAANIQIDGGPNITVSKWSKKNIDALYAFVKYIAPQNYLVDTPFTAQSTSAPGIPAAKHAPRNEVEHAHWAEWLLTRPSEEAIASFDARTSEEWERFVVAERYESDQYDKLFAAQQKQQPAPNASNGDGGPPTHA